AEAGLQLLDTLWFYWNVRGHLGEWRERTAALLATPSGQQPSIMRARGLNAAGYLALAQGDEEGASLLLAQALTLARQLELPTDSAMALRHLGIVARMQGDLAGAVDSLEQSLRLARAAGDAAATYLTLFILAGALRDQGANDRAIALYEESLALMRAAGDRWHT